MADDALIAQFGLQALSITAVNTLIGKATEHIVIGGFGKLRENLRSYKPDGNHEIQAAILRSYLQATLQVAIGYGETIGISPNYCVIKELLPRFLAKAEILSHKLTGSTALPAHSEELMRRRFRLLPAEIKTKAENISDRIYESIFGAQPQALGLLDAPSAAKATDETAWLKQLIDEYTELLIQLDQKTLEFPAASENPALNETLADKGLLMQAKSAEERETLLRERLLEQVEQEIIGKMFGALPGGFRSSFLENWFNYFCGCFHYQLARNPELARKFQSKLLAGIEADVKNIQRAFERFGGEVGDRLAEIESSLAWLAKEQKEGFEDIRQLLLAALPLIATLNQDSARTQVVAALKPEFDYLVARVEEVVRQVIRAELQPKNAIPTEIIRNLTSLAPTVYGRDIEADALRDALSGADGAAAGRRFCLIVAPSGFGKSFLLTKALQTVTDGARVKPEFRDAVQRIIRIDCGITQTVAGIVGEFANLVSLELAYPADFGFPFAYLNGVLFHYVRSVGKTWLILDNFEAWLDGANDYQPVNGDVRAFLKALFEGNHSLRGVLLSQSAPANYILQKVRPLDAVDKNLYAGLPRADALRMLRTEGAGVGLDTVAETLLDEFLAKVASIPQAINSLLGYMQDGITLHEVLHFPEFRAGFERYESDAEKVAAGERRTDALIARQIAAQSPAVKLLLQALTFFAKPVPQEALELLFADAVTARQAVNRLKTHRLAADNRDFHGVVYDLHAYFRRQTTAETPDSGSVVRADYAAALGQKSEEFLFTRNLPQKAFELADCAEMIYQALVEQRQTQLENALAASKTAKGNAQYSQGTLSTAIDSYDAAIRILERLVNELHLDQFANDLAMAYMNKGNALASQGNLSAAIDSYDAAIRILERLVNELHLDQFANELAAAYMNKGVALDSQGNLSVAIDSYDAAIRIYERLVNELHLDQFANELAAAYMNKGVALYSQGNLSAAIDSYDLSEAVRAKCLARGEIQVLPEYIKNICNRTGSLLQLENWQRAAEEIVEALDYQQQYRAHLSDHFNSQIAGEIDEIISRLKELKPADRAEIYRQTGKWTATLKARVGD